MTAFQRVDLVKCKSCSFVFCEKIPSQKELFDYYSQYALSQYLSPITVKRYNEWLDQFESYRKTNNMLDVGCANGLFLDQAKMRGWNVYGSEYGDDQVAFCRSKGIEMHQGPLDDHCFPNIQFDVILSIEVIEHINNPREEMARITSRLRPGGIFYCTTPNFNALSRFMIGDKYNIISYPEHLSYYTPRTLKALMRQFGLKKIKVETTGISITRLNLSLGKSQQQVVSASSDDELLRQKTETIWYMKMAKSFANFIFNLTGLGYALKGTFQRPNE